jgi:hypothetical protein
MKRLFGTALIDYLPALALLAIALAYLATAYSYMPQARAFPVSVALATIVLVVLDLVSRTQTPAGQTLTRLFNPSALPHSADHRQQYPAMKQVFAVLSVFGFVLLIVLAGFIYAVPVYVFAATYLRGRRPLLLCLLVSVAVTIFIWALFEQFLKIELYPGLLFQES